MEEIESLLKAESEARDAEFKRVSKMLKNIDKKSAKLPTSSNQA